MGRGREAFDFNNKPAGIQTSCILKRNTEREKLQVKRDFNKRKEETHKIM
jgi:hypothetical protein